MSSDEPEDIVRLITDYPEFKVIYDEVYNLCLNVEKVMEMFSKGSISSIKSEYDKNGNLSETMVNITYTDENGGNHRTKVYIDAE